MSLANYTQLKTALETWKARQSDPVVTGNAADFVTLGESRLNRILPLNINRIDLAMTCGAGSRNPVAFPTDFVEPIALFLTTDSTRTLLKPEIAGNFEYGTFNSAPSAWCMNSNGTALQIDLDSPCDRGHTFSFRYRKSFALSDASPTNWLLTNHPDVYLDACLVELEYLAEDWEAYDRRDARLDRNVQEILWKDSRLQALAPLSVDPALRAAGGFNINTG